MERVLAFGPHPDDVEFHCAGALALLAKMGHEIHIATMTGGDVGSLSRRRPRRSSAPAITTRAARTSR